jgi:hypothetical protein
VEDFVVRGLVGHGSASALHVGSARLMQDPRNLMKDPKAKVRAWFFDGCLWPANFLSHNNSQAELASRKWPVPAMF